MEENNNEEVRTKEATSGEGNAINSAPQGSYITGTIGAVIGGAIASLPWILVYVYGNMIVAILAILIALGAFYGYKIAKGKMGKGLPAIISIVSVAIIVVLTTIVCPLVILSNEGMDVSLKTIKLLYENSEIASAIMQDALVSIAFTIVGIAGTIKSMKMQIKSGATDIKFSEQPLTEQFQKYLKEQAEETKKAFDSLGAINKENTAEKKEIINELIMTHNVAEKRAKANFQLLYNNGIIKKAQGKYYYDVENEETNISSARQTSATSNAKTGIITVVIVLVVVFAVVIIGAIASNANSSKKVTIPNTNISMHLSNDLRIYDTEEKIKEKFGEDYADYYDFAILDKDNQVEVYGFTAKKSTITGQPSAQELAEQNKTFADQNYTNVTPITTKKIGKIEFKHYTYNYGETTTYLGNLYIAEIEDKYLYIDCYADLGNQAKIDEVMNTLFK